LTRRLPPFVVQAFQPAHAVPEGCTTESARQGGFRGRGHGTGFDFPRGVVRLTLILIGLFTVGCATAPKPPPATRAALEAGYSEASAAALAVDPPLTANEAHPELARAPREPAAYLGYQDSTVEAYTTYTDNLESSPYGDAYAKESVTVKSNTRYR
jgi:hypothetical protein